MAENSTSRLGTRIDEIYAKISTKERTTRLNELCRHSSGTKEMLMRLRDIQRRLGGPDENMEDEDEVESIAHKLNNILCGT